MPIDPLPPAAAASPTDGGQVENRALPVELSPAALKASRARHGGLGVPRGLINGFIFTLGLWLAITGFVLLVLR